MENLTPPTGSKYYAQSEVDEIHKGYTLQLASLQHDLNDMRQLYEREQDKGTSSNQQEATLKNKIRRQDNLIRNLMKYAMEEQED